MLVRPAPANRWTSAYTVSAGASKIARTAFAGLATLVAASTTVYPASRCKETVAFAGDARAKAMPGFQYERGRG